jgi:hypothetical protein
MTAIAHLTYNGPAAAIGAVAETADGFDVVAATGGVEVADVDSRPVVDGQYDDELAGVAGAPVAALPGRITNDSWPPRLGHCRDAL